MDAAEFDRFADEYYAQHRANIAVTGELPEYFAEYKVRVLRHITEAADFTVGRLIDFGAGIGNSIPHFRRYYPGLNLACADVSQRSLEIAQTRFPREAEMLLVQGDRLAAEDGRFDAAFSACVFHHIDHGQHVHWLRELRRVTRPGGLLAIFEHNPLQPLTVHAVRTCPFDANARLIPARQLARSFVQAGWARPRTRYHLFFPRALARLRPLEPYLASVPFGAQYSVIATNPA